MAKAVTVGTVTAAPGDRASGWLVVGELDQLGFARGQIRLPVIVANGSKEGPILALIAGQHPGEYVGMNAAIRIANTVELEDLVGAVIAVPVLNPYGVKKKIPYICPLDGLNMNRQWPGTHGGTVSMRTADAVWQAVVLQADYLVDLHGGDFPEYQADYAICFETDGSAMDDTSREMAQHFGAPYIRTSSAAEGGHDTGPAARMAMQLRSIPAIVSEVGDAGALEGERLSANVDGIANVMRVLGMLPGDVVPYPPGQREMVSRTPVLARASGLCQLMVSIGQSMAKDSLLAEIRDPFGQVVEEVRSPIDGDVVQLFYQGWINEGDIVAKIASIAQTSKEVHE